MRMEKNRIAGDFLFALVNFFARAIAFDAIIFRSVVTYAY